jgi:hypothetical protein
MGNAVMGDTIREAFLTFGRYLSDTIPPVEAVEPVCALLNEQPALMSSEIIRWASGQRHGGTENASITDYVFHGVNKLNYLMHLQLISPETMTPYLNSVKQQLLNHFPDEERRLLRESFDSIGTSEGELTPRVSVMRLKAKSRDIDGGTPEGTTAEQTRNRRHSVLWNRLTSEVRQIMLSEKNGTNEERDEGVVPQLIAAAASDIQTSDEFRRFQQNLSTLRINPGTDHIFRTLSRSLPGWMIPTTGADAVQSHNPAIEAMGQIIQLAEDRWEACKRFQDMVQAAIEQFNAGSLARAATMFDLALSVSERGKVDENTVDTVRKTAHVSLDLSRLRDAVKDRDRHRLLLKVLDFFHEFAVENMLESLRKEEKRDRRHLLLSMIEIFGDAARKAAFENLKSRLGDTNVAADWHFARNLVCILNAIPRTSDIPVGEEVKVVSPFFKLSLPLPLIKEAIKHAGQNRCAESEALLIDTAEKLEQVVLDYVTSGKDPTQLVSLLDRTIFALAHFDTPTAHAMVIEHGVSRCDDWGDTASRLAYLSGQDLTAEKESLSLLIQFLKNNMPRKLLGMTIQKNEQRAVHAIKALSSTPAPIVRQTFESIVARHPESKFGKAAAAALKEFNASEQQSSAEHVLTGDMDLFGLPDLLHQLNALRATGVLTLKDSKRQLAGIISLVAGRMRNCNAGRLEGLDAMYQLLEVPTRGFFAFQGQKSSGTGQQPDSPSLPDLLPVLSEGMRRYDDLQRLRAIVPDFALLRRKEGEILTPIESEDADLVNEVWQLTAGELSPERCEAACTADSYRIRSLLARWVETGVLTTE